MREVTFEPTLEGWRDAARRMLAEHVPPAEIAWRERPDTGDLFTARSEQPPTAGALRVPREFLDVASEATSADDPARWAAMYAVLWRIAGGEHGVMRQAADPEVRRLRGLAAAGRGRSARGARGGFEGAAPYVPDTRDLAELSRAIQNCKGCDLYRHATQAVFGEGSPRAKLVLVGEQPGDQEDLQGHPFVGPAGAILDKALAEAKIPRKDVFVTNAVKHFKFERTPKRRIHQTPTSGEVQACRPWLYKELETVKPDVLVCLGATASKAVLGPGFRLLKQRGEFVESSFAPKVLATYHPSAALRADDDEAREKIYGSLVRDLRKAASALR